MKRKIQRVVISLFVLGIVVTLFAETEEYDYGKVRWGMTIEEVEKATGAKDIGFEVENRGERGNTEEIGVFGTWYGFKTMSLYGFDNNLLKSVHILISSRKSFSFVSNSLKQRFGTPLSNEIYMDLKTLYWGNNRTFVVASMHKKETTVVYVSKIDLDPIRRIKFSNENIF